MTKIQRGFTLIELLVVLALISILAAILVIIVNPLEITKFARDSVRLNNLREIQNALNTNLILYPEGLCASQSPPCIGYSNENVSAISRKPDGTGWIKFNFAVSEAVTFSALPQDPLNDSANYYTFYSDGEKFEINTKLEAQGNKNKMFLDGGDNINVYEVGSSTVLMH